MLREHRVQVRIQSVQTDDEGCREADRQIDLAQTRHFVVEINRVTDLMTQRARCHGGQIGLGQRYLFQAGLAYRPGVAQPHRQCVDGLHHRQGRPQIDAFDQRQAALGRSGTGGRIVVKKTVESEYRATQHSRFEARARGIQFHQQ